MNFINDQVCLKQWQLIALLLMSGFATGTIAAKLVTAAGL